MKQLLGYNVFDPNEVAPYAGAWIETVEQALKFNPKNTVAPYAGAWIETMDRFIIPQTAAEVAPYAGAWIETSVKRFK